MKEIDMKATGLNLSQRIKEHNLSVMNVALLLSVNQQSVYKWLQGKNIPTVDNLVRLSSILNCSINELVVVKEELG